MFGREPDGRWQFAWFRREDRARQVLWSQMSDRQTREIDERSSVSSAGGSSRASASLRSSLLRPDFSCFSCVSWLAYDALRRGFDQPGDDGKQEPSRSSWSRSPYSWARRRVAVPETSTRARATGKAGLAAACQLAERGPPR